MRVKVEATTVWFMDGDELVKKYPFLKDPRFKVERVLSGKKKEHFTKEKGWFYTEVAYVFITIGSLEDLQEFIKLVNENSEAHNGETILSVDEDGQFCLEIYDGWRE